MRILFLVCAVILTTALRAQGQMEGEVDLGKLLNDKTLYQYPPIAKEYHANSLKSSVRIYDSDQQVRELINSTIHKAVSSYGVTDSQLVSSFWGTDIHLTYQSGFEDRSIKEYFINSLVVKKRREAISSILNDSSLSNIAWFRIYDIGSEIIGTELIFIQHGSKFYIVELNYMQS